MKPTSECGPETPGSVVSTLPRSLLFPFVPKTRDLMISLLLFTVGAHPYLSRSCTFVQRFPWTRLQNPLITGVFLRQICVAKHPCKLLILRAQL